MTVHRLPAPRRDGRIELSRHLRPDTVRHYYRSMRDMGRTPRQARLMTIGACCKAVGEP